MKLVSDCASKSKSKKITFDKRYNLRERVILCSDQVLEVVVNGCGRSRKTRRWSMSKAAFYLLYLVSCQSQSIFIVINSRKH